MHFKIKMIRLTARRNMLHRGRSFSSKTYPPHLFTRVQEHDRKNLPALFDTYGNISYSDLFLLARKWASILVEKNTNKNDDINEQRIAFLTCRSRKYVAMQWAIWLSGGIAVPLYGLHPVAELEHILHDADVMCIITEEKHIEKIKAATKRPIFLLKDFKNNHLSSTMIGQNTSFDVVREHFAHSRGAQLLYTSGTTGVPKGVLMTHGNLSHQLSDLEDVWGMSKKDHHLHCLPLHHTHGILCQLLLPLYAGASVEMCPDAKPTTLWKALSEPQRKMTLMMAVPTLYATLLETADKHATPSAMQTLSNMRVTIAGSMACPVPLLSAWKKATGQRMLERYGMTEAGMILSQNLRGIRIPGTVGTPLPSVNIKVKEDGKLLIAGPSVFSHGYWRKEAVLENNDAGWFDTGDFAEYDTDSNTYRLLGRGSVDIFNRGGYKISALEIERVLLEVEQITEAYVIGISDDKYGQRLIAILRLNNIYEKEMSKECIQNHLHNHLAKYKHPQEYLFVQEIPKNALGKVNKKQLAEWIQTEV